MISRMTTVGEKHADTEAFGLAFGGIEFGVGSFHNSGLAIPGG